MTVRIFTVKMFWLGLDLGCEVLVPGKMTRETHVQTAADKEHSGGEYVEVVQLYAGHHRHHQEADQLQEEEEGVEVCEELVLVPGGVDAVVHGAEEELGSGMESHDQGPDVPLRSVTADRGRDRRSSVPDIAVSGGHLLEVEDVAVEETEDEAGDGHEGGGEGEIPVLDVEHDGVPCLIIVSLFPGPAHITTNLSVYQALLLT